MLGERLGGMFAARLGALEGVREVRSKGLMIGIEMDRACGELVGKGLDSGILINVTADSVIRLLPPLVMSDDEAGHMASKVCDLVEAFCRQA
jgi:acetylornithine aminotransferase